MVGMGSPATSRVVPEGRPWCPASAGRLIIPLIIQTIRLVPSGPVWIDEAPNVSRADPSGADQSDAEHQATDLAVAGLSPPLP